MSNLTMEDVRCSCVVVMRIEHPVATLARITQLFLDRRMEVQMLHMLAKQVHEAEVEVFCRLEQDHIKTFMHRLEKLEGVLRVDWREGAKVVKMTTE